MMTKTSDPLVRELAVIPAWAIALAALVFLAAEGGLLYLFMHHERNPPPLPLQLLFGTFIGSFLAALVLGVGYVNRDARRRGMKAALWTVLVIFVPNAIGFILYFLLRRPLPLSCPGCGASARAGSRYCPGCGRPLVPACPHCGQAIADTDAHCPSCGRRLRE
jgi:hypothetical protein